ncbi:MAG: DUF6798 domain-containing protein, partial [Bryobacteraceae bacterium]
LVYRSLQVLGIYLLATSLPLSRWMALLVAAISSLGATISGPAVLTMEYEPVPRGYAVGLTLLAVGLAARNRWMLASVSASLALLYHAPTTYPFWIVLAFVVMRTWNFKLLIPVTGAIAILLIASRFQTGATESQSFFFHIDPAFAALQRMRASYNWVSLWWRPLMWQHLAYWAAGLLAFWRIRPRVAQEFLLGMPLIGILSVPASYLLLERLEWGLIPQLQPARALLFVTEFAIILGAAAGVRAAMRGGYIETFAWFVLIFAIPMNGQLRDLTRTQMLLAAGLSAALVLGLSRDSVSRLKPAICAAVVLAAYLLPPTLGRVHNYAHLETPAVDDLAHFARERTPKDAMFLFADAGTALYPGIFSVRAQRPVWVDWKSGGQVNYYRSLADEWWSRWQATHGLKFLPADWDSLAALGINYVVLGHAFPGRSEVYSNGVYYVYALRR